MVPLGQGGVRKPCSPGSGAGEPQGTCLCWCHQSGWRGEVVVQTLLNSAMLTSGNSFKTAFGNTNQQQCRLPGKALQNMVMVY